MAPSPGDGSFEPSGATASLKIFDYLFDKVCTNCTILYICFTKYIQMGKEYLGEFEELVLTMVGILQEDAYGNAIVNEIKERLGRDSNLSAVHVTLYRLEDKGMIKSRMGGATNARGGRRKRIFTITNAGLSMLKAMKESRMDLWKLIPRLNYDLL
jgi:DNA-binding PadR family transcriptional regulator